MEKNGKEMKEREKKRREEKGIENEEANMRKKKEGKGNCNKREEKGM